MTNFNQYVLGGVPSPEDSRDFPVARLTPLFDQFPLEFRIPFKGNVKHQGDINSCVGESLSYTRDIKESEQRGKIVEFSPGFIYGLRRDGQYMDLGMIPREALSNLKDFGAVLQSDFPLLEEMPDIYNSVTNQFDTLKSKASENRISAYAGLDTTNVNEFKTALMHRDLGPITAMFPIDEALMNLKGSNAYVPSGDVLGRHQMTIVGWRQDNTWIVLNSWGVGFGDNGYCYWPFTLPFIEAWSITDTLLPHPESEPAKMIYWRVQVGAFSVKSNALNLLNELKGKGIPAYLVLVDGLYRVQTGAFVEQSGANNWMQQLKAKGYDSIIKHY